MNNNEVKNPEENNGFPVDFIRYEYTVEKKKDEELKRVTKRKSTESFVDPRLSIFLKMPNSGCAHVDIKKEEAKQQK